MVTYYVGEEDEHLVDHPPLFACRDHKKMLRFNGRFAVTAVDVAIELRGLAGIVQAMTGDLVLCDADGAIVVPGGLAQHVVEATERAAAVNARMKAEVMRGVPRIAATGMWEGRES